MRKSVVSILITAMLFAANHLFAVDMEEIVQTLKATKKSIDFTLARIDKDLKAAAQELSGVDFKSDAARKILSSLCEDRPYVIDCAVIDAKGIKVTVEPEEYRKYEGDDRSELPYVITLLTEKRPVMSDVYHSDEGVHAISIGYPIFSQTGEFLGAVRMLVEHEVFLKPIAENRPCKIWVMQKNGLVVYDADPDQIGKSIFSDAIFKPFDDLVSFSKTVALSTSGAGSYSFYIDGLKDRTLAEKIAVWETAGIYGTAWRVVAIEIEKPVNKLPLDKKGVSI